MAPQCSALRKGAEPAENVDADLELCPGRHVGKYPSFPNMCRRDRYTTVPNEPSGASSPSRVPTPAIRLRRTYPGVAPVGRCEYDGSASWGVARMNGRERVLFCAASWERRRALGARTWPVRPFFQGRCCRLRRRGASCARAGPRGVPASKSSGRTGAAKVLGESWMHPLNLKLEDSWAASSWTLQVSVG